jgi:MtN3 and saliva related transmembrane protein
MQLLGYVGGVAAVCTTVAFIPQIVKIRSQGGGDQSYPMLALYLTGTFLWLVYGLMPHADAVILANAATFALVVVAAVLKATYRRSEPRRPVDSLAVRKLRCYVLECSERSSQAAAVRAARSASLWKHWEIAGRCS